MSKKKESSDYQDESSGNKNDDWADATLLLKFVEKKFSDQRLFSAQDIYSEWKNESKNVPSLKVVEENLNKLVEEQKIDRIMNLELQGSKKHSDKNKRRKKKTSTNDDDNDNDDKEIQPKNLTDEFRYQYTCKYKYIPPKGQVEMAEAFYKIKNEMIKSPVTILALSEKLNINHQKIRSIVDVLTCLDIVKPTSKGGTCIWDQFQENRIRNVKNIYPQLVQRKKKELQNE